MSIIEVYMLFSLTVLSMMIVVIVKIWNMCFKKKDSNSYTYIT